MDHVERLFKVGFRNYTRYIGFACSLGECYNADPVATQCTEELSRDARYMLHVLAHDGDGCQVVLHHNLIDAAHADFVGKFLREYLLREGGVLRTYSNGGAVF